MNINILTASTVMEIEPSQESYALARKERKMWEITGDLIDSYQCLGTRRNYDYSLSDLCEFLRVKRLSDRAARKILGLSEIDARHLAIWLLNQPGRHGKKAAPQSVKGKLNRYRVLYATLQDAGLISANPITRSLLRQYSHVDPRRPGRMFTPAQKRALFALHDAGTEGGRRARAILALLFGGALRRSEVTSIRLDDLRVAETGTLVIRISKQKNKRISEIAIRRSKTSMLLDWVDDRRRAGPQGGDLLFPGLTPNRLGLDFRGWCRELGFDPRLTTHHTRHTAITELLDSGVSHREAIQWSRHSSVTTIERYDRRKLDPDQQPGLDIE